MLQSLVTQFETTSQYWDQINPPYEVDFLIQRGNDIFPVEVKADTNFGGKSHRKFKELFADQVKLRGAALTGKSETGRRPHEYTYVHGRPYGTG